MCTCNNFSHRNLISRCHLSVTDTSPIVASFHKNHPFACSYSQSQDREAGQVQPAQGVQWRRGHRLHQREERQIQQEGRAFLRQIHGGDQTKPGERYSGVAGPVPSCSLLHVGSRLRCSSHCLVYVKNAYCKGSSHHAEAFSGFRMSQFPFKYVNVLCRFVQC